MDNPSDAWRQTHLGRLLGHAMRRFDERVLSLMAHDAEVPLALSNLAARAQVSAAHIHITRHLAREGSRLTELADRAQVTKQTASLLVAALEREGLVERVPDPSDGRARLIRLSARGREAATQAMHVVIAVEQEWTEHLGPELAGQLREGLMKLREITDPYA